MTPADPPGTQRSRAMRLVRVALVLVALYLVGVNALINTALLEPLVNRKPERFTMHWDRGLMLWPGRVMLWDVSMQGQARRQKWRIQAQRVSGRIALWPLLRKELRFVGVDAKAPVVALERVDAELPPPPPTDRGLRLAFDEVRVDSPLRFSSGSLRIEGHANARARWRQQLRGGPFELLPSTLRLSGATLAQGERVLLREAVLEGEARIDAHRRREHPGIGILELLSADATLHGATPGVSIDVDARFDIAPDLHPGSGELDGRIVLERGAFGPDTALRLRLPVAATTHAGHATQGDARLALDVDDERIGVAIELPSVPDLVEHANARLALASRALPLPPWEAHLARLDGEIDLRSRFSSLAFVQPLLSRLHGLALDGHGDVEARIVLARGELAAGTQVTVHEAEFALTAYSHRFHGAAKARADIRSGDGGQPHAEAQVTLARYDIAPAGDNAAVLGSGRNLVLDLATHGTLAQLRDHLQARLRFADATLPDISRFNRYLPKNGVRFLSGSGRIGADMRMHVADNRNGGTLTLAASAAALRLGEMVMRGDLSLDARLDAGRLDDPDFALPGTRIAIRRAAIVEPPDERVEGWWGTLDITRGKVGFGQPMDVAADADVAMRDIGPLLSMFAQHKRFPRWIRRLVDAGEATVSARVKMQGDSVIVDPVHASNERFDVKARLRLDDARPSGHLYARWGVFGMGMELDRGEREFHLAGAKKWFEAQAPYLPER